MKKRALFASLLTLGLMSLTPQITFAYPTPLPTSIANFYMRGTQPNGLDEQSPIVTFQDCFGCHQSGGGNNPPPPSSQIIGEWSGSLMAHAARDPVFYACLDIAEADAPGSGDTCIRCHSPKAWLEGRSTPTDGSAINQEDRDSITCNFCHRMVNPFDTTGTPPPVDNGILADLGDNQPLQSFDRGMPNAIGNSGNGNYVVDPRDRRRGPFALSIDGDPPSPPGVVCYDFHYGETFGQCQDEFGDSDGCPTYQSPFHLKSELCATCHDVSFPHFSYNMAGTQLVFNGADVEHPDGNKYNMVAEQRTYSEWLKSDFAVGAGVDLDGRFGGPGQEVVSQCQDCHMPAHTNAKGCAFVFSGRNDIPNHSFSGAATWVLDAIAMHYGPDGPMEGFPPPDENPDLSAFQTDRMASAKLANIDMLGRAADLAASLDDSQTPGTKQLKVRVTNQTGHKLPTGYIEGRRMWLTVEFYDCTSNVTPIVIKGEYNATTADLDTATTKVYHAEVGPDSTLASMVGMGAAPSPHAILGNKMYFDNRIPPRGFTNAKFEAIQAAPVDYVYADGQYWDDTYFDIPAYAVGAKVHLYYQSTSRDYINFLRDENPANGVDPTNRGELAYALWEANGKSAPVEMAVVGNPTAFNVDLKGDLNGDRQVTTSDIPAFIAVLLGQDTDARHICAADMNSLNGPNGDDIQPFVDRLLAP